MQNVTDMLDKLTSESKRIIKEHSLEVFPIESCGIIIDTNSGQKVLKSKNIFNSEKKFLIDNSIFDEVKENEKMIGAYHSHTRDGSEDFSTEDLTVSEKIKIPFVLYNVILDEFKGYTPTSKKLSLIGRPYFPPVFTCITILREYYEETLGINIDFIEESETISLFNKVVQTPSVILFKSFKKSIKGQPFLEGFLNDFKQVETPKKHDVFLMKLKNFMPELYTHCGVFNTDETFIAVRNRVSTCESIDKILDENTISTIYLRHKSLL